jgi:hypothetical protein
MLTLRICGFIPLHPYTPFWCEQRIIYLQLFLYGAAIGQSIQGVSCSLDDSGMYLLSLRGKRTFTPFADCTKQLPIKRLPQALFPDLKRLASAAIGTLSYLINFSSFFFYFFIFFRHLGKVEHDMLEIGNGDSIVYTLQICTFLCYSTALLPFIIFV